MWDSLYIDSGGVWWGPPAVQSVFRLQLLNLAGGVILLELVNLGCACQVFFLFLCACMCVCPIKVVRIFHKGPQMLCCRRLCVQRENKSNETEENTLQFPYLRVSLVTVQYPWCVCWFVCTSCCPAEFSLWDLHSQEASFALLSMVTISIWWVCFFLAWNESNRIDDVASFFHHFHGTLHHTHSYWYACIHTLADVQQTTRIYRVT